MLRQILVEWIDGGKFFYLYQTYKFVIMQSINMKPFTRFIYACVFLFSFLLNHVSWAQSGDVYVFNRSKIRIEGNIKPFEASIDLNELGLQRYEVTIYLHSPYASVPQPFSLTVKFPKDKINQLWNSKTWSNKSSFTIPSYDRAAAEFSIISGLTINDQNQITLTCKDLYRGKFISSSVTEVQDSIAFKLGFFEDNPPLSSLQDYHAKVFIDFRNIRFSEAVLDASKWLHEEEFKKSTVRVDTTNVPVFSTWYPMHRNIPLENITRELDSLRTFQFKSILIDDGWQALVNMKVDTTYSYEQNSFETMNLFKQKCEKMNLPIYLWYSLPFVGGNPVILKKFEGKYIRYRAPRQMYVLDPRYADVRKYLIKTYIDFLEQWKFDGYWFDFLKGFYPSEGQVIDDDLGRDFVSINLAVDTLYSEMAERLKSIRPDIFLGQEFQVVGPNLVSYQSFLTGFVGVENTQVVREKMVNNRLLYGKYTPFMEVVAITPKDKPADIARKMQAVLFGNPYLSFFITTMPEESKQVIRFWLEYWKKNYEVIFNGDFEPMQVSRFYPVIKSTGNNKIIYALYDDYSVILPKVSDVEIDVINSKASPGVSFGFSDSQGAYGYEVFNCQGKSTGKGTLNSKTRKDVEAMVPVGGYVRIKGLK